MNPYIGITDFTTHAQVKNMLKVLENHRPKTSPLKLGVGVMMSFKTLHDWPSKWANIFVPKEKVSQIFSSQDKHAYHILHYVDYEKNADVFNSLSEAIKYGGPNLHALQLDMVWPEAGQIASGVCNSRKNVEVILQIGKLAFDEVNNNPEALAEKLEDYQDVIAGVLLDKSMGRGIGMDATDLLPFVRLIKKQFPKLGIVLAGGLGPTSLGLVAPLAKMFPNLLSIDAQSKLRPSGQATSPIDWKMAGWYLRNALHLLS